MLRGSSDFDSIPVAPESVSKTTLLVGYFADSFEVCFDGFEGAIILQPSPFYVLNSYVPRIVSAFAGTQSA